MNVLRVTALVALLAGVVFLPSAGDPIAATCIWALCMTMLARSHPQGILSFAPLYLLMLGLFHLGLVAPIALGITRAEPPDWLQSAHLGTAIGLFSVATAAFTLGAHLRAPARPRDEAPSRPPQPQLFAVGFIVALIGATFLWIGVQRLGVLSQHYGAYYERALTHDVRFFGFGLMLFPIGLLVASVGSRPRQMYALGAVLLLVLGPLFLRGFRGPLIVQVTALLAIWARKDTHAARRVALAVTVAAIVLVPAVRLSRDGGGGGNLAAFDPISVLLETGGSLHPLVVTAELVESGRERPWMGRSYAMAAGRIAVNVGRRRASAWDTRSLAPNSWVTMHEDTWAFENGYGIGFSGVAEPYLNFGQLGVVLFFLLLGYLTQAWDRSLGRDPFLAAVGAATFGFVLWTVRNDAMELFRALAFVSATVSAAWLVAKLGKRRRLVEVGESGPRSIS